MQQSRLSATHRRETAGDGGLDVGRVADELAMGAGRFGDRGEIHVEYQPLADASTKKIVSFEALARWDHPRLGRIAPAMFIPIAEESGLMPDLGRFVLETATKEAATWSPELKVGVNLSPAQMEDDGIVDQIGSILRKHGLSP